MSQSQLTFDEDFSEDLFSDTELSTICNTTNTDCKNLLMYSLLYTILSCYITYYF